MRTFHVTADISAQKCREIGRFITHFSLIEFLLQQTLYGISGTGPKVGRYVVREFRTDEYLDNVERVAKIRSIKLDFPISSLAESVGLLSIERNKLAHGVWVIVDKRTEPWLRVERGKWETIPSPKSVSRKEKPEAMPVTMIALRALNKEAASTLKKVHALRKHVEDQVAASQEKRDSPPSGTSPHL